MKSDICCFRNMLRHGNINKHVNKSNKPFSKT